ncbi:MAG: tRNA pseudouridine(38-40) synthase TruA [Desulfobulbaceae bacterium]|nr:MAG: tRNA pseudouridine(38-40) synthase TruA [Desulfobulbaceae bacterium]
MENICLTIAYDGGAYGGWQRQRNRPTIQASIEGALARILGSAVVLHGAGRTDAGVHARGMVANFNAPVTLPLSAYRHGLNGMLPADIRILAAEKVEPDFHARYKATGKVYRYHFSTAAIMRPCSRLYQGHFPGPFRPPIVRAAFPKLLGEHDFSSFEAVGSRARQAESGRGAMRHLTQLSLHREERDEEDYYFVVAGDGFLRHMVRNIVGTLMEIGQGKRDPDSLTELLAAGDRSLAGPTAPACGLFLQQVDYG